MLNDLFFKNATKTNKQYLYNDTYLYYTCVSILYEAGKSMDINDFKTTLIKNYSGVSFKNGKLNQYIKDNFNFQKDKVSLSKEDALIYETKILDFQKKFLDLKKKNEYEDSLMFNFLSGKNVIDSLASFYVKCDKNKHENINYYSSLYFYHIKNEEEISQRYEKAIANIDYSYLSLPLEYIIEDKFILDLVLMVGYEINNLQKRKFPIVFFSLDINYYIKLFESLSQPIYFLCKNKTKEYFSLLSDIQILILDERNGFYGDYANTLDYSGKKHNLTRERCRQIEKDGTDILLENPNSIIVYLRILFYEVPKKEEYATYDEYLDCLGDKTIVNFIKFLYNLINFEIVYEPALSIFYNKNEITLELIEEKITDELNDSISLDEFASSSKLLQAVITRNYNQTARGIYIKKGLVHRNLVEAIIDDLFPKGYSPGDEEDYMILKKEYIKRYGDKNPVPSIRAIAGCIERQNYCLIDRGKFLNHRFCVKLPKELLDEILNYLESETQVIFYQTIFAKFNKSLIKNKIKNFWYLKGLLDIHLPTKYITKRDYIILSDKEITTTDSILEYIQSKTVPFTIDELSAKYLGVENYVFYNVLYKEGRKNLIWLSRSKFVYYKDDEINITLKQKIEEILQSLFVKYSTRTISAKMFYVYLSNNEPDILPQLPHIGDIYSLFSVLKYLFTGKFYFEKPLISLDPIFSVYSDSLVFEHFKNDEKLSSEIINDYCREMGLKGLYSYLKFIEKNRNHFVQSDLGMLINKNNFIVTDEQLNAIRSVLDDYLETHKEFNSEKFSKLKDLPNIPYSWNGYLLVGIVRSFFSNLYSISSTSNNYSNANYVIRKIEPKN